MPWPWQLQVVLASSFREMGATWRGGRGWGRMGWGSHVVVEGWEMAFKEDVWLPKRKVEAPQLEAVHESQKPRRREDGEACCNGWSQAEANEGKRRETAEVAAAAAPPQLATAGLATAASQQPTSLPSLAAMAPTACTCPTAAAMAAVVCSNWVEALPRKASRKWWEVPLQGTSRRGPKEGEKERYRGGERGGGRGGGRKWNHGGGGCRGRDRGGVEEKGGGKRKGAKGRGGSAHPHRTSRAKGEGGGGWWASSGWCRGRGSGGGGGDPLHGMGWGQTQRGPPRTTLGKSHREKEEKEEEKGWWGEALNKGFFTLNKGCFLPWTRAVCFLPWTRARRQQKWDCLHVYPLVCSAKKGLPTQGWGRYHLKVSSSTP